MKESIDSMMAENKSLKSKLQNAWNDSEALYIENQKLKAENESLKSDLEYADDRAEKRYIENRKLKEEVASKTKFIYFLLILIGIIILVFGSCEAQKAVSVSNAQASTISTTSLENWLISVPFVGGFFYPYFHLLPFFNLIFKL